MHIESVRFIDIATKAQVGNTTECSPEHQPTLFQAGDVMAFKSKRGDELDMYQVVNRHFQQVDDLGAFGLIYNIRAVPKTQ